MRNYSSPRIIPLSILAALALAKTWVCTGVGRVPQARFPPLLRPVYFAGM